MLSKRRSKEDLIFDAIVFLLLLFFLLASVYPLIIVLSASVSTPDFVNRGEVVLLPKGFQLNAYQLVLKDRRIMTGYANTILYTVGGTIISVTVTVMAAFSLSRKDMVGHSAITWFFLITMYINGGLIPTYLQVKNLGLVGSRWSIVIIGCVSVWNLIVCRTFFQSSIPEELWDAASIDGCSMYGFFGKIVLPNSKAVIAIMVLYYAVAHWNDFFKALIYLSDVNKYPLQLILRDILLASQTISVDASPELYEMLTQQAETMKFAMVVVASLPVLCLYPFVQKYFVKGVMVGAVKG